MKGTVTDQHSNRLEKATVQVKDTRTLAIRSYVTQADGMFHFAGLNRETDYEFTAEYDGIRSPTRTLSRFDSRDEPDVALVVHLGR